MSIIQDLQTVSNDVRLSFEEKLQSLLEIGIKILDLETIKQDNLKGGVVYHDGQFDDSRLAVNIAQTCQSNLHLIW